MDILQKMIFVIPELQYPIVYVVKVQIYVSAYSREQIFCLRMALI